MAELLEFDNVRERSKKPLNPKVGDLLAWHIYEKRDGKYEHFYKVEDQRDAFKIIDELAKAQVNDDDIIWNALGLIVWESDEWCEWLSDDGDDINEAIFDDINFRCDNCSYVTDNSEKFLIPNWDKKHFSCKQCLIDEGIPEEEWVK